MVASLSADARGFGCGVTKTLTPNLSYCFGHHAAVALVIDASASAVAHATLHLYHSTNLGCSLKCRPDVLGQVDANGQEA